jgi:hypothetical protein
MLRDSSQFIDNQPTPFPATGLGGRPEPARPAAHSLLADAEAALSWKFLDIAQAQREAEAEPDRVLTDGCREAAPFVRYSGHWNLLKANEHGLPGDGLTSV